MSRPPVPSRAVPVDHLAAVQVHVVPGADAGLVAAVEALVARGVRERRWVLATAAHPPALAFHVGSPPGAPEAGRAGPTVVHVLPAGAPDVRPDVRPAGWLALPIDALTPAALGALVVGAADRMALHAELQAEQARYQFLLEATELGDWDMDVARNRTRRSLKHDQLFGYDALRPTWGYDDFLAHVHPDDREAVDHAYRTALAGEGDYNVEFRALRADGRPAWLWSRGRFVLGADGTPVRAAGIVADITARREAEFRLRALERDETLGRLAAAVAHDFNNLLTVILGGAEFLAGDEDLPPHLLPDVAQVRAAGQRAAAVVRRLLTLARGELARTERVPLALLLDDLAPSLERVMGDAVRTDIALPAATLPVLGDPRELEQVLLNLALNARDAMPTGGRFHVRLEAGGAGARLVVRDSGVGMDADTLARCFEPLYTTKPRGQGTGIGLAAVRATVERMRGRIAVESAPGAGTTFTIELPLAPPPDAESPSARAPERAASRGARVLVVDDDPEVREVARRVLADAGHRVRTAASAEEATRIALELDGLDALVSDVVMPGMGGRALAEAVLARWPGTRVLLVSGYSDDEVARHGVEGGRWAFLAKPFAAAELRAALDALLASSAAA